MSDKELMQQSLNVIERLHYEMFTHDGEKVIEALRKRLAQDDNDFPLGKACDLSGEGTCEACQ